MNPAQTPGEQFRPDLTSSELERVWGGLESAQRRRALRRTLTRSVAVSATLALLIAVGVTLWMPRGAPLTAGEQPLAPGVRLEVAATGLRFDDGSRITPLSVKEPAQLEVVANEPGRFATALRRGSVRVQVTPKGPRRWTLDTDLATVEVVGTVFEVDRTPEGLLVRVQEGTVVVQGERVPGRIRRVTAGEEIRVAASTPAVVSQAPSPAPTPEVVPSMEEALDRAGAARRDGRFDEAQAGLLDAMQRLPSASERATVGLEYARVCLGDWARPAEALPVLEAIVRSDAAPELVESALAMKVRALGEAGRAVEARAAAHEYQRRFPQGTWSQEVQRWAP